MKTMLAIAAAAIITAGTAFAQTDSDGGATDGQDGSSQTQDSGAPAVSGDDGGATDAGNYLSGPNVNQFYTDETMSTLRSDAEVRSAWEAMSQEDRDNLRQSCEGNADSRWSTLCNSIGAM